VTDAALARAERAFAARFGDRAAARHWWVPGRIELLGKHIDYAGGRSLLAAIDRGFHIVARPRSDNRVHLLDALSGQTFAASIHGDTPPTPGRWTNYVVSVLRRVARDFPTARTGMDAAISSSLPSAAGLSSSSALVVAGFLPLAAFNALETEPAWAELAGDALPGYLGAVENGLAFGPFAADLGVGTQGGSQDHTAILGCRRGRLSQFRFLPVARERDVALPDGWRLAVASSGVVASKSGGARERYNRLSEETTRLLDTWNAMAGTRTDSLLDVLASTPDAEQQLAAAVGRLADGPALAARLAQFREECTKLVPAAADAMEAGAGDQLGVVVDRSHHLAVTVLRNQVAETSHLAASARELGAVAASAFGAGFGGSVWAIFETAAVDEALARWRREYLERHPDRGDRADFFLTAAGGGAAEVLTRG
jgi:galactokinase